MFTQERQQLILDILSSEGRVEVINLAQKLGVSDDTVRRDLQLLSESGFLQKVHGGAVSLSVAKMSRVTRKHLLTDIKSKIGAAIAEHFREGQTIILDAGNTTLAVARALRSMPLRIITNSLDIANYLSERPEIELIIAGGRWDARQRLFFGAQTLQAIGLYRADMAIIGACAVHARLGVTASSDADAAVKRAMMNISMTKVLAADHSKFEQSEPHFVADLSEFDMLFTDYAMKVSADLPLIKLIRGDEKPRGK